MRLKEFVFFPQTKPKDEKQLIEFECMYVYKSATPQISVSYVLNESFMLSKEKISHIHQIGRAHV